MNPEIRAAEIVAACSTTYACGGYFEFMTRGEQAGWNLHEYEWWYGYGVHPSDAEPRNRREMAGWLAREIIFGD